MGIKSKIIKLTTPIRARLFYGIALSNEECNAKEFANDFKRILVVAPHADDEYLGSYNFIKRQSKVSSITVILCSYLGKNCSLSNKDVRENEFIRSCHNLSVNCIVCDNSNLSNEIENALLSLNPDCILVTPLIDPHPEHRAANYIVDNSLQKIHYDGKVGWYQITMPIYPTVINYIQPYKSKEKWNQFRNVYRSQKHMNLARFECEEAFLGQICKCKRAEGFFIVSYEEWHSMIQRVDTDSLKLLSDIKENSKEDYFFHVYKTSKEIYSSMLQNKFRQSR